jgi:D-3-phosphoglycerate dehydrogenase / 2-oxoglutarate reductase
VHTELERVVLYTEGETGPPCGLDEESIRQVGGALRCAKAADEAERLRMAQPAEVLVLSAAPMTREFLAGLPRLKGLVRSGIGVDTVDLQAATELGIAVANVPDFCEEEVAEHTLAMVFAVARRVALADRKVRRGGWYHTLLPDLLPIRRLSGRTMGLVGLGRIGQSVAHKVHGLGLEVVAFDPYLAPEIARAANVRLLSLEELLRQADIVSLHVPLTPETRHLISAQKLDLMKAEAILINMARGPVVDEAALETALALGRLAGAGLDVLEQEPPRESHPFFKFENVVLTCHYASYSQEAYADLCRKMSAQIVQMLRGELPRNLVNRQVENLPQCRLGKGSLDR